MAGRPPNQLPSEQITISTTPRVVHLLEQLVDTGLYGKAPPEAAERLLAQSLYRLMREDVLIQPAPKGRAKKSPRQKGR